EVNGLGEGAPDYLDILSVTREFHKTHRGSRQLVPFFANLDTADYHCFDKEGRIWFWSHEEPGNPNRVNSSFERFLLTEAMHLQQRKDAVKESRARHGSRWRVKAVYPERPQ